ncbi:MAG: LysR family transcriptional regulator [Specibacter sp.]
METRRLHLLLELSRVGSMRGVAEQLGTTTSTVSQQLAMLAKETGTTLLEPVGRGVRLTPAGRRLAEHARVILAEVEAATADLDPGALPAGTLRVAGFVTAIRETLMPVIEDLAGSHPRVTVVVYEQEPAEALALLANGDVDLALTYDYNLTPAEPDPGLVSVPLWSAPWSLGVPAHDARNVQGDSLDVFTAFRESHWIGNSRNRADEDVMRIIASMAGFVPSLRHQSDSLDLVEDLILAGMGVGILPANRQPRPGVALVPLTNPEVLLRAHAVTRRGRDSWAPLALLVARLTGQN